MKFKDKYTNEKDKEAKKTIISNDAYAIGELLDAILFKLRRIRING